MLRLGAVATLLLAALPAFAAPLTPEKVPEPLKPWTGWALHGHENAACPFLQGVARKDEDATAPEPMDPACQWPARLDLVLEAKGGRFSQNWRVFRDGWASLPGDAQHFPQDVKVDGQPAPTQLEDGTPAVFLKPGDHTVTGTFVFDVLPESLQVPEETGLLSLTLRGKTVASPSRDASGLLWLQRESAEEQAESKLDVTVWRLVQDEVPMLVTTRVRLDVSGKSREVVLAKALLDGFAPLTLDAQLPARVEPDGRLRVQVRPGTWTIDVVGRHDTRVLTLAAPTPDGPWAAQEAWAFDARPDLRVVEIGGVPAIDPQQTTLPEEWRQFPAYRLVPGDTMRLTEQRRGDADPSPDRLSLTRALWLDFDGGGYSVRDQMTGTLTRSWRLNMPEPTKLGRVTIDGRDQLITRTSEAAPPGVEIRQGAVRLAADSRVEQGASHLPAVGWDADFHEVSGVLHLPPGWRLIHASGVDDVPATWIRTWTLLDLFLVLITAVAVARLFGRGWGVLALAGLGLTFPESGTPHAMWLFPLAFEALSRVLQSGKLAAVVRMARIASWAALAIGLVLFAVQHVRVGMYPILAHPYGTIADGQVADRDGDGWGSIVGSSESLPSSMSGGEEGKLSKKEGLLDLRTGESDAKKDAYQQQLDLKQIDPNATVQTGPGLPEWMWDRIDLRWSGPVERAQQLRLFLTPPSVNLVLAFLRVVLVALLFARFVGGISNLRARLSPPPAVTAAVVLIAFVFPAIARADYPSEDLLHQLRDRMLERPDCYPDCASSPRLGIEAADGTLRIRQEIGATAHTAVPLPGGLEHWVPERVLLDGQPAKALRRGEDGALWIELAPGMHQVQLEGALSSRESVQIPLPLKPFRVEAKVSGWTLDGLHEDGTTEDNLQLTREGKAGAEPAGRTLEPGVLPPFVRVERALLLGLDWQVETRVVRLTAPGVPVVLAVPLIQGESVTSPDVRAESGKAIVNMGPRVTEVRWRSVLQERAGIQLTAPEGVAWTEVWRLEASPVWHVEASGIPPVHHDPNEAARIPEWRPWPGEAVSLQITRPGAVPGQSLTIQGSTYEVSPGLRATDAKLTLRIASSRGGQHTVTLPEGAQLQALAIDGHLQPLRQDGRRVTFPVHPGHQEVQLDWREPIGIALFYRAPQLDLGAPSVNARGQLSLPADRWVLFVGGPRAGPAVLFWSLLLVLVVLAAGLGRMGTTPLRTRHWVLLALGLTQVPVSAAALVVGWLLVLGWRRTHASAIGSPVLYDLFQLTIAALTIAALAVLFTSIEQGLLGLPEMQVVGNGSTAQLLRWFEDRAAGALVRPWVLSVPMMVYRGLMLCWALWLAVALLGWLRWGWSAFTEGGLLRSSWSPRPRPPPLPKQPPPPAPDLPPAT